MKPGPVSHHPEAKLARSRCGNDTTDTGAPFCLDHMYHAYLQKSFSCQKVSGTPRDKSLGAPEIFGHLLCHTPQTLWSVWPCVNAQSISVVDKAYNDFCLPLNNDHVVYLYD